MHKSGNELSLDLHKSGNELSLDLHKSGNKLSLDLHINESPKWNSSLLDLYVSFAAKLYETFYNLIEIFLSGQKLQGEMGYLNWGHKY